MAKTTRTRNWTFLVYPDSAPEDWFEQLSGQFIPGYVSPLHDKDVNPDGTPKKPHWHVVLCFSGVKTYEQVREVSKALNGTEPQAAKDIRALARYLVHIDNPEKAQYEIDEVRSMGGADYLIYIGSSESDIDKVLGEVMRFCRDNCVYSYQRLCDYASENRPDWFRVITSKRTLAIREYLRSLKWTDENEEGQSE